MKPMSFQDDIPSIPIDIFKNHYVSQNHYVPKDTMKKSIPGTSWRTTEAEINFTLPLEHVTELIVLGERMSSVAVNKFGVVGKSI